MIKRTLTHIAIALAAWLVFHWSPLPDDLPQWIRFIVLSWFVLVSLLAYEWIKGYRK
jgi:uncharacterized protein (DUF983 family)